MDNGKHNSFRAFTNKIVPDYKNLELLVKALRLTGEKIVVTIGSWDLLHIGHVRYLIRAKGYGDKLIVGVDSDAAIKLYKGPLRPIVPEQERIEMLSYQDCVDYVTAITDVDEKGRWQYELIKLIKPDVFVAVEDSYDEAQRKDIKQFCGELIVLPRQAEGTSTTKLIQDTIKNHLVEILRTLEKR